jgi:hypothetical protein
MCAAPTASYRSGLRPDPRIVPDRRRHRRFPIALLGRFMRANKQEYPCRMSDLSVGGAAIMAPVEVEEGERIVAYFDEIGGIEGKVVRVFDGGFAIALKVSAHKREKLAAQICWLVNKDDLGGEAGRQHQRIEAVNKTSTLVLSDGSVTDCRVLDFSLSGASIGTIARPALGDIVTFGKLRCKVMRHHDRGIGVQFIDIPDPEALRRYFG